MDKPKHKYYLYIMKCSLDRNEKMYDRVGRVYMAWDKTVISDSRTRAIEKCYPEIARLIATINDPTIKYISVFCGLRYSVTGKADRLHPIQVDVATGKIREKI